jgi:Transposase DDE domain
LRLDDGELLIVISDDTPEKVISNYAHRWGIETLFGMFKTRGFCIESTHFQEQERLSKLIALMSLALCWAVKTGEWLSNQRPLKVKKHGRLENSVFRYGFDYRKFGLKTPSFHDGFAL